MDEEGVFCAEVGGVVRVLGVGGGVVEAFGEHMVQGSDGLWTSALVCFWKWETGAV